MLCDSFSFSRVCELMNRSGSAKPLPSNDFQSLRATSSTGSDTATRKRPSEAVVVTERVGNDVNW